MQVAIMGAGNMARGIATRALAGGHQVRITDRASDKAAHLAEELRAHAAAGATVEAADDSAVKGADLVVLALPFDAAKQAVASLGARLNGTVVVDISNPVDFSTFDSLTVAAGTSAAEEIAKLAAPDVHVVKAFNTTFAGPLVAGQVHGMPLDVFIAGDDEAARTKVAELASSGGLNPIDVGALKHARELEGIQLLHMALQLRDKGYAWMSALKIIAP
jgi:NADPH-dependent F420 reductase